MALSQTCELASFSCVLSSPDDKGEGDEDRKPFWSVETQDG